MQVGEHRLLAARRTIPRAESQCALRCTHLVGKVNMSACTMLELRSTATSCNTYGRHILNATTVHVNLDTVCRHEAQHRRLYLSDAGRTAPGETALSQCGVLDVQEMASTQSNGAKVANR